MLWHSDLKGGAFASHEMGAWVSVKLGLVCIGPMTYPNAGISLASCYDASTQYNSAIGTSQLYGCYIQHIHFIVCASDVHDNRE